MMRRSLTISFIVHFVLLGLGILSMSSPRQMAVASVEAVPVEIIEDLTQVQEGEKTAKKEDKPAPKPSEKPKVNEDAVNPGETEQDIKAPPTPTEKPKPVETATAQPPAPVQTKKAEVDTPETTKPVRE